MPGSINAQRVSFVFVAKDSRAPSRTFMRHRPFKDMQVLSHDGAISFLKRTPVT